MAQETGDMEGMEVDVDSRKDYTPTLIMMKVVVLALMALAAFAAARIAMA